MRTGKYRVRKTLFGKAVLQAQYDTPSFICGQVDSNTRDVYWQDVPYKYAPDLLQEIIVLNIANNKK